MCALAVADNCSWFLQLWEFIIGLPSSRFSWSRSKVALPKLTGDLGLGIISSKICWAYIIDSLPGIGDTKLTHMWSPSLTLWLSGYDRLYFMFSVMYLYWWFFTGGFLPRNPYTWSVKPFESYLIPTKSWVMLPTGNPFTPQGPGLFYLWTEASLKFWLLIIWQRGKYQNPE